MEPIKKVVLVTGASSGIGLACAHLLQNRGWLVYGTTRRMEKGTVEVRNGIRMVQMEVTDPESVQSAVELLTDREGQLDALVNNAGSGIAGAVEDTDLSEAVSQFDVNFFGALTVCRACLPWLIKTRGMLINISSVAAILPVPFQSMYSASKAALEALSEALRCEVRPFGVRVCLVEPGDTRTGFTAMRQTTAIVSQRYSQTLERSVQRMAHDEQNGMRPEAVAAVVSRVIDRKNPPVRVAVGLVYKLFSLLKRVLPARLVNRVVGLLYG